MILTSLYELPFGKGKHFLGNIGRGADLVLGGWQWNTTMIIGTGLPFSPSYDNCNSRQGHRTLPADLNRELPPWVPAASTIKPAGHLLYAGVHSALRHRNGARLPRRSLRKVVHSLSRELRNFGNIHRNQFTGPGEFLSDMSIFKNFTITERVKAQFQAEFFNVFNHPVYTLPEQYLY